MPALFCYGVKDKFIDPKHTHRIASTYGGECTVLEMEGDHNTPRPFGFYEEFYKFMAEKVSFFSLERARIELSVSSRFLHAEG